MQLKSVKLVGFKSFVDPTTIPMMSGMNGVVGPNGCGKSNIIDAVRWVIGERSAKQLRGQSMADVIFNGTAGRKPVGRASVELLFDNADGSMVGPCAQFAEIAIKREVFRDGQSHYYLNGTACRRQDIVDIFYGTGLGSRSYAIIEQGMISRLIEAKPEDLRNHIEEAAGIAKYKQRRHDTENRMSRTQENLSRLLDLQEELEKQLKHLQRQAAAAERYKILCEEVDKLNSEIKAIQWQALQVELEKSHEKIQQQENARERVHASQRTTETEIEKLRLSQLEATDRHHAAQKEFYSVGSDITRIEQTIQYTKDELERCKKELQHTRSRYDELSESTLEYESQIEELNEALCSLRPQSALLSQELTNAKAHLHSAEAEMDAWNAQWDVYQTQYAEHQKTLEVARTKGVHYQDERRQLAIRVARLTENRLLEEREQCQGALQPLQAQLSAHMNEREQCHRELEQAVATIQEKKVLLDALQKKIHDKRSLLQTEEARKTSLEVLQAAVFQPQDTAVTSWLSEQQLTDYPRLGKHISVVPGWEVAVETVLKGFFDAVCIDDLNLVIDHFKPLASGELVLLESKSSASSASVAHSWTSLASLVTSEWPLAEWLSSVFVVDSLAEAKAMRHQLLPQQSFITKDGVWLGKHWLRIAKTVNNENSVLLREHEIKQLADATLVLKNELIEFESDRESLVQTIAVLEQRREQCHVQVQSLNNQITQTQTQLTASQTRYDTLMQQEKAIDRELQECHQRDLELKDALEVLAQTISEGEAVIRRVDAEKTLLASQKQGCIEKLNRCREQAQAAKQRADEYDIRLSSNESQLAVLQQTLMRDHRQLEQLSAQQEDLLERVTQADDPLASLHQQLQQQLALRSQLEQSLVAAAEFLQTCNNRMTHFEKLRDQYQLELNAVQEVYQQLQLDQQSLIVRQATIQEQLQQAGIDLNAVIAGLPPEALLPVWEQRAAEVAARIAKLGPINLAAIEECETLKERKEYIDKQHADLQEALTILQTAIRKIDKETRSKFKETFDQVTHYFQALFPKIFGGGAASLELDHEDLLLAGIVVKAQPPGKRNATIHMLSGGEKALTAIALVFSLFQLNPAPFCILDEVDAPLDDLNVGRYCRLISEMSSKIQFIVISHNKVTIESCHRLMGITMQEPGVSRVVSVDIDEAVSLAEV